MKSLTAPHVPLPGADRAESSTRGLRETARRWPFHQIDLSLGSVTLGGYTCDLSGTVLCSPALSPHHAVDELREQHVRWAGATGLAEPRLVDQLHLWDLWTDCIPNADVKAASIVADYCLLFTVMDDAAERYFTGSSMEVADGALRDIVAVIAGRPPSGGCARDYPKYSVLLDVTADLRDRILACDPSHKMYELFIRGMDRYRYGVIQQIWMSQRRIAVSRETQLYNRYLNVALDPTIVLLCMLAGIDISGEMSDHPMMERLHIAICRLGAVMNDIVSFPKEVQQDLGHSQYHNLVAAGFTELARLPHIENPLQLAIARAFDFHNNEFRDVLEIGSEIAAGQPRLEQYVHLGLNSHRSFLMWCLSADRYRAAMPALEAIRAERRVRIVWPEKAPRQA